MNIMFFLKPKSELAFIHDYHTFRQALEIMEYHRYTCVPMRVVRKCESRTSLGHK